MEKNRIQFGEVNALGQYVPDGTGLIVSVRSFVSGLTVFLKARIINKDGFIQEIQKPLIPTSDGVENFITTTLMEGILQSVHVYCDRNVTVHRGQVFASVWIQFGISVDTGTPILVTVAADYVENLKPVSWPDSGVNTSLVAQGAPNETIVSAGGSNAEGNAALIALGATQRIFTFTVPSHMRMTPQFLAFGFTPSAGTPDLLLAFLDAQGNIAALEMCTDMVDTGACFVTFDNSNNVPTTAPTFAATKIVHGKFPIFPMLTAGMVIAVTCNDAGASSIGKLAFTYESWIDPQDATTPTNPGNALPSPPSGPA